MFIVSQVLINKKDSWLFLKVVKNYAYKITFYDKLYSEIAFFL